MTKFSTFFVVFVFISGIVLGCLCYRQYSVAKLTADTSDALNFSQNLKLELEKIDAEEKIAPEKISELSSKITDDIWYKSNSHKVLFMKFSDEPVIIVLTNDGRRIEIKKNKSLILE